MASYRSKNNLTSLRTVAFLSSGAGLISFWLVYSYPNTPEFGVFIGILLFSLIFIPYLWEKKYARTIEVANDLWQVVCWDGKEFHFSKKDIKDIQVKGSPIRKLAVLQTHLGFVIRFTSDMEGFSDLLAILGFLNQEDTKTRIRSLYVYLGTCWVIAMATGVWAYVFQSENSTNLNIAAVLFFLMGIFIAWSIIKTNSPKSRTIEN